MKKTNIYIVLILLTSCGQKINQETISNLDRFKSAKENIIKNFDSIIKNVDFHSYDSLRNYAPDNIFSANRFYFDNTVSKDNNELKSVLKLWDDKLMTDEKFNLIILKKDTTLLFNTYSDNGTFSGIEHFIVYDSHDKNGGLERKNSKILKVQDLDNHWYYIIEKEYYID